MAINRRANRAPACKRGHTARKTPLYRAKISARVRRNKKAQAQQVQANQQQPTKLAVKKKRRSRRNPFVIKFTLELVAVCGVLLGLTIALVVFKDVVIASILPTW